MTRYLLGSSSVLPNATVKRNEDYEFAELNDELACKKAEDYLHGILIADAGLNGVNGVLWQKREGGALKHVKSYNF